MRPNLTRATLLCLTALLLSTQALAADVWKVSSKSGRIYLGGTFHLLTAADYPLPSEYDLAYRASQSLVLETDLDQLNDPAFQSTMIKSVTFEPGKDITTVLKPQTVQKLETFLAARGIPLKDLAAFKPGMLMTTLTVLELQRQGLTGTGVDEYFHERAKGDRKSLQWFETAQQQLDLVASMGEGQEDALIISTLRDMENIRTMMGDMKEAWREGDSVRLEAVALAPSQKEFPQLMESILYKRNDNWMPEIERMLGDNGTEFILVGALHLVGKRGLLSQLQQRGYVVEKVSYPAAGK